MSKVAVVYWSGTGNTEAMAEAVAQGARGAGAEVDVITAASFDASQAGAYSGIAFGCPAMGAEQLEDGEFEPMWDSVKGSLAGKKIGLFGSYSWGDGEWMRTWQDDAASSGAALVGDGVIANDAPDDAAKAACEALGASVAG